VNNNYFFDKKKVKLFFTVFFRAPTPPPALVIKRLFLAKEQKIRWEKVFLFLSDMKFCFMKRRARTLSANHARTEAADLGDAQANR
jgi:hypothetical protein